MEVLLGNNSAKNPLAFHCSGNPDSKAHGANMGPTWVLSSPGRPHVGPINLAIREGYHSEYLVVTEGAQGSQSDSLQILEQHNSHIDYLFASRFMTTFTHLQTRNSYQLKQTVSNDSMYGWKISFTIRSCTLIYNSVLCLTLTNTLWPLLLTWINFNPSMDK